MKKLLKALGVVAAVLIVLAVAAGALVRSYLKSEKLKAVIIPRIEERVDAAVELGEIRVSLFKGIVVKDIRLTRGGGDLLAADEFILDYSLLPLLSKRLVIKRVELVSPRLTLRREKDGRYNFSNLMKAAGNPEGPPAGERKGLPVALVTEKVNIRDATLRFTDARGEMPEVTAASDIELRLSFDGALVASGSMELEYLRTAPGGIDTDTSGSIRFDSRTMDLDLLTAMAGGSFRTAGTVKDYLSSPVLSLDFSSEGLDLTGLGAKGKKAAALLPPPGPPEAVVLLAAYKPARGLPLEAAGNINLKSVKYGEYELRDFKSPYRYKDGVMELGPVAAHPSSAGMIKASGEVRAMLRFDYLGKEPSAVDAIKRTLRGEGVATFGKGAMDRRPLTSAVATITGIKELEEPGFDSATFNFKIAEMRTLLDGVVAAPLFRVNTAGTVGFDKRLDLTADLRVAPQLEPSFAAGVTRYLREEEGGWSVIPLKIGGTAEKPSVGVNTKAVGKKLEKELEKKVREEIEKRLFPSGEKPPEGQPEGQAPAKKPEEQVKDLLKGILGK
ncbi:MAG: hypothetical protein Kow0025_13130 [Thermodesulfovibrionales bacterium]